MGQREEQIQEIIKPAITAMDVELVGVEFHGQGKHSLLRVYIDREGGVDADLCAEVSYQVSAVLDIEDPISEEYTLEISSPGIDRPLFTPEHYLKQIGKEINLHLARARDGRRKFRGVLTGATAEKITLEDENGHAEFSYSEINKANVIHRW
ncbi:MAG: ribosome maturation factor RimP [Gammaproteobacteria bacterium]|nr:ribosome maturation factor RimP [Gammaproteobacteria bacterium]